MADSNQPLVDPNSKISIGNYYEPWDKAFAKAHSPAGYVGGLGSYVFMEGEGPNHDEYQAPDGSYVKGSGWMTGFPIADDTAGLISSGNDLLNAGDAVVKAVDSGKWPTTQEIVNLIASAAGVVISGTAVAGDALNTLDPAGMGLSWAISWLLTHVRPFRAALDGLVGNPDIISAYATSWGNIADCIADVGTKFGASYRTGMGTWTGPAYNGYLGMATTVLAALDACAKSAKAMKLLVTAVADVVSGVRGLIISLIGTLASETLDAIEGLCGLDEEAAAGTEAKIAKTVSEVATVIEELGKATSTVMNIVGPVNSLLAIVDQVVKNYSAPDSGS